MFAYPLLRTILMSLHSMPGISSRMSDWTFVGLDNFTELFHNCPHTRFAGQKNNLYNGKG